MSFSFERRTLRSGSSYNLKTCPRTSAHDEETNAASELHTAERIDEASTDLSPNPIEYRVKAILEPLHAQMSTLTQMMNKLIQDNSVRANPLAGSRDHLLRSESLLTDEPGTSRTLSLASLATVGY